MGELGDLLELLHTSDSRWRTFRATGREWRHTALLLEAFLRDVPRRGTAVMRWGGGSSEEPVEKVETWALWIAPEGKARAEFDVGDERVSVVFDRDTWWSWSPSAGAQTNAALPDEHGSHGTGPGATLLETAAILPALTLEVVDHRSFVGRPVVVVRATPVRMHDDHGSVRSFLHGLGSGGEAYELLVDSERGVLLRSEARLGGRPFMVLEVDDVAFDEEFPPETFVLELPPGETFSSPPDYRDVPLSQLPSLVSFTVFVPEHPPVPGPMEPPSPSQGMVMPAAPRWNMPELVHIGYQLGEGRMLTLRESAEPMPIREGQELEARGELLVGEDRTVEPARTNVRLDLEGTHVELEGMGLTLDELIELASTLVRLQPRAPEPD